MVSSGGGVVVLLMLRFLPDLPPERFDLFDRFDFWEARKDSRMFSDLSQS